MVAGRDTPAPGHHERSYCPVGVKGSPGRPRLRLALDAANLAVSMEGREWFGQREFGKNSLDNLLLIEGVRATDGI